MSSDFKIITNGREYTGWEDVYIIRSMNTMCGAFAVGANDFFIGGTSPLEIKNGGAIKLKIDDQIVIDGYIDRMPVKYGRDYKRMDIYGRDVTMDLVDCSFDFTPNEWKTQTVYNLIKNMCAEFDISITLDSSVSTQGNIKIDSFKANEGMTVSSTIQELCMDNAIIPISKADGRLTLTKAAANDKTNDGIMVGVNAQSGYSENDNRNRFSSYKVKGYGIGNNNKTIADYISCSGSFSDSIISRTRPLTLFSEIATDNGKCQNRAKWEARIRAGLSRAVQYEVQGWTQSNGNIWDINKLVKVEDDILGENTTKLINEVVFSYDENGGEVSRITVVDKDTYNLSDNAINIKSEFDA